VPGGGHRTTAGGVCAEDEAGLTYLNSIVIERAFGTHCTRRLTHQHYVVSLLTKGPLTSKRRVYHELAEFPRGRNGGKYGVDVWREVPAENRAGLLRYDNALHPLLPGRLIRMTTNPGDLVADPFLGGGSTAVACLKTGRRFYGGDLNPHALRLAVARILAEVAPAMHADAAQLALLDAVSGGWA
jgi:DNA methylase